MRPFLVRLLAAWAAVVALAAPAVAHELQPGFLEQDIGDRFSPVFTSSSERLQDKHLIVSINDQTWNAIRFSINKPVCI